MGSTGHGLYKLSNTGNVNDETFGIANAVNFKGRLPEDSGIEPPGNNKITLKVQSKEDDNIIFQFKLTRDLKRMTIIGFKDGIPQVKCKVAVDSGQPSLDRLIAHGNKSEKLNAIKMKDLISKSTDITEGQLGSIANKLLSKRKEKANEQ